MEGVKIENKSSLKSRTVDISIDEQVNFEGLHLSQPILVGLRDNGFERPSPIQLKAIPLGRCGLDLIVQAKSGTGKTCVFTVIALESIDVNSDNVQAVVLAPTREIAVQIHEVMNKLGAAITGLECQTFIGGLPVQEDRQKCKKCHIAIGTPGRVKQLLEDGSLKPETIRLFILDEADKLMDDSMQEQINWIYSTLPENKQMLALSATYPEVLAQHLTAYMRNPTFVRLNSSDPSLLGIRQYVRKVRYNHLPHKQFDIKTNVLIDILSKVEFDQCLVFSNYQMRAQSLSDCLNNKGWPTTYIAGSQEQPVRLEAMKKLKKMHCRVLVSTDLTSRGIDAENINLVINLDIPWDHETYLHRIGRAGRFGTYGAAVTLASAGDEVKNLELIQEQCNTTIQPLPEPVPCDLAKSSGFVNLNHLVTSEQLVTNNGEQNIIPKSTGSKKTNPNGADSTKPSDTDSTKPSVADGPKPSDADIPKPSDADSLKASGADITKPTGSDSIANNDERKNDNETQSKEDASGEHSLADETSLNDKEILVSYTDICQKFDQFLAKVESGQIDLNEKRKPPAKTNFDQVCGRLVNEVYQLFQRNARSDVLDKYSKMTRSLTTEEDPFGSSIHAVNGDRRIEPDSHKLESNGGLEPMMPGESVCLPDDSCNESEATRMTFDSCESVDGSYCTEDLRYHPGVAIPGDVDQQDIQEIITRKMRKSQKRVRDFLPFLSYLNKENSSSVADSLKSLDGSHCTDGFRYERPDMVDASTSTPVKKTVTLLLDTNQDDDDVDAADCIGESEKSVDGSYLDDASQDKTCDDDVDDAEEGDVDINDEAELERKRHQTYKKKKPKNKKKLAFHNYVSFTNQFPEVIGSGSQMGESTRSIDGSYSEEDYHIDPKMFFPGLTPNISNMHAHSGIPPRAGNVPYGTPPPTGRSNDAAPPGMGAIHPPDASSTQMWWNGYFAGVANYCPENLEQAYLAAYNSHMQWADYYRQLVKSCERQRRLKQTMKTQSDYINKMSSFYASKKPKSPFLP